MAAFRIKKLQNTSLLLVLLILACKALNSSTEDVSSSPTLDQREVSTFRYHHPADMPAGRSKFPYPPMRTGSSLNETLDQREEATKEVGDVDFEKTGDVKYLRKNIPSFFVTLSHCLLNQSAVFTGRNFALEGFVIEGDEHYSGFLPHCSWTVEAPKGYFLVGRFEALSNACAQYFTLRVVDHVTQGNHAGDFLVSAGCENIHAAQQFVVDSKIYIKSDEVRGVKDHIPWFRIRFDSVLEDPRRKLVQSQTSFSSGFLAPWGHDGVHWIACNLSASYELSVPESDAVMVSFYRLDFGPIQALATATCKGNAGIKLFGTHPNGTQSTLLHLCRNVIVRPKVFQVIKLSVNVNLGQPIFCSNSETGFVMKYSFHPKSLQSEIVLQSGKLNCSTPVYHSFQQHVLCNLEEECEGGEDEGEYCPFSSPQCRGMVASRNKCYKLFHSDVFMQWAGAKELCRIQGGLLATVRTDQEWDDLANFYRYGQTMEDAFIGLHTGETISSSFMYRRLLKWTDGSIAHTVNITISASKSLQNVGPGLSYKECAHITHEGKPTISFYPDSCHASADVLDYICEFGIDLSGKVNNDHDGATFPTKPPTYSAKDLSLNLFRCEAGHITHDFLACDPQTYCRTNHWNQNDCPLMSKKYPSRNEGTHATFDNNTNLLIKERMFVNMFVCDEGNILHYSLVCDFKPDCMDASDENFCVHTMSCLGFTCTNRQCVTHKQRCNFYLDCWDQSDEAGCYSYEGVDIPFIFHLPLPALVNLNSSGHVSEQSLEGTNDSCPETHFACFDGHCLPVYMYCNGVADCSDKEDEKNCQQHQCPGYYRCRSSSVCVHPQHLCDGWPQCPQHDDEWLCHAVCPTPCLCQGLSFVCQGSFPASSYADLRYLDSSGTGMTLQDLSNNTYLIWLSLASCKLRELSVNNFPNLQILDLSFNELTTLSVDSFLNIMNLKELRLIGNIISTIECSASLTKSESLYFVDLSHNLLRTLTHRYLLSFSALRQLNVSFNKITIIKEGFGFLSNLSVLDLRGNKIEDYPAGFAKNLTNLRSLYSDDFRLCCSQELPESFHQHGGACESLLDPVSSCSDLLQSDRYRILLWVSAAACLLGNGVLISRRLFLRQPFMSPSFDVVLGNLWVAHGLMGVYLLLIGCADLAYRGRYLTMELSWRFSSACWTAAALFLLSFQASFFLCSLLLLERILALKGGSWERNCRPVRRTAALTLTLSVCWTVALVIAAVTLLPMTSHWRFYSLNGLCVALPVAAQAYHGESTTFGIRGVLNTFVSLVDVIGLAILFRSSNPSPPLNLPSGGASFQEAARANRASCLILLEILSHQCLACLSLAGSLSSYGTSLLQVHLGPEVDVVAILAVAPLGAALSPFLYCLVARRQRRQQGKEELLLQRLKSETMVFRMTLLDS